MGSSMRAVIVDALGSASGVRRSARDAVGCGPRRVAGILESKGLETKILPAEDAIKRPDSMDEFSILMVSAMSVDSLAVQKIINLWRHRCGHKPAIVGGPIACHPERLLHLGFDVAVVGEGERSIIELLENGLKDGELLTGFRRTVLVEGMSHKRETGRLRELCHRECSMQSPAQRHELLNSFDSSIACIRDYPVYRALRFYVEVARGCSNFLRTSIPLPDGRKCIECQRCRDGELEERIGCPASIPPGCGFCSVPSLFGYSRSRNEDLIMEEVKELIKAGARRITLSSSDFLDYGRDKLVAPNPLTDPHHPPPNYTKIEELLSRLVSIQRTLNIREEDHVYMSVENIKPCLFDEETASIIAEHLPNSTIHLGCETGSEEHSLELGRPSSPTQTLEATRIAVRHGLRPYVYFIHGLPGQTTETARKTVEVMNEIARSGAEKITLYRFKPLPMSAFETYPMAPPAKKKRASNMIEETARRLNTDSKRRLIGRTIEVITFKHARKERGGPMIAYPLSEGPVVALFERDLKQGMRLKIKITEVLSDRLVKGEPL
jgi:radical SAM superfamily enzyme YgiQ (UPF0313 family)